MHNASSDVYADSAYPATYDGAYPSYNEYPPQGQYGQQQYPGQAGAPYSDMDMGAGMAGAGAGAAGAAGLGAVGATVGESAAAASGIHDGMMVRVKVAFVRSLEDELGTCRKDDRWPIADLQRSPPDSNSTSTPRTTTAGRSARTRRRTAVSCRTVVWSHGMRPRTTVRPLGEHIEAIAAVRG